MIYNKTTNITKCVYAQNMFDSARCKKGILLYLCSVSDLGFGILNFLDFFTSYF